MVLAHDINEGYRSQDVRISQDISFNNMFLSTRTLHGLNNSGFHKPSPIQLHGIPLGKCGFDLLLEAKSGTGKTAVFSVIALEKIHLDKGLQVVILAPTREIAMQIHDVIKQIGGRYEGLNVEVVMGGLPVLDDVEKFKKNVHIVVGSPGRLKHLIQDKYIVTNLVRLLILDEADKLMEKSFEADINYIHSMLPQEKQVIMSSATFPERSKTFIKNYVQNAQHICPESTNVLLGIEQRVTLAKYSSNIVKQTQYKFAELIKILSNRQFKQCLIFCNYQARVGELNKMLTKEKWPSRQLYGQQQQTERLDALKILQEYKCRLLIATDLAARGIDASNVDLVINFESPCSWDTYLHRIGRAGRFGSYGLAITILSEGMEYNNFKSLIESLKLPFLLKYLWSNTPFCINNNTLPDTCHIPDINNLDLGNNIVKGSEEVNYTKLWDALTGDEKTTELESFDDLCKSFKEHKIDLFNDLIEQNVDNTNSENINCSQLDLLNLTDKGRSLVNENDKMGAFRKHNGNSQTVTDCSKVINLKEKPLKDNQDGSSTINSPVITNNSHDLNSPKDGVNYSDEASIHYEIEDESCCQELVNFDLPTSFSGTKQTQSLKQLTHSHNRSENKWDTNRRDRRPNKMKFTSTMENKEHLHREIGNKQTVEFMKDSETNEDNENYVTQTYSHYRNKIYDKMHLPSASKHKNKSNPKNMYHSKNICEHQNTKEYDNYKYIEWYNSLKLYVRQIEQSIYLNEIGKF